MARRRARFERAEPTGGEACGPVVAIFLNWTLLSNFLGLHSYSRGLRSSPRAMRCAMFRLGLWVVAAAVGVGLFVSQYQGPASPVAPASAAEPKGPDKAAVERTREQVKMLDDLYKTAVVKITKVYVGQQGEVPAAVAAMEIFEEMKKKGWHSARLVDASGKPKNKDNVAK